MARFPNEMTTQETVGNDDYLLISKLSQTPKRILASLFAKAADLTSHKNTTNPHNISKGTVGLGNVDNTSDANKPVSTATQTALNAKISTSQKGVANGVATLGSDGKVPASQLPDMQSGSIDPDDLSPITTVDKGGEQYMLPIFDNNGNTKKISVVSLHKEGERVLPSNLSLPCLDDDWTLKSGWQASFATARGWSNWQSLVNSLAANDPSNANRPERNGTMLTLSGIINGKRVVVYPQYYEAWAEQGIIYLYGVLNYGTVTITSSSVTVLSE